MSSDSTQIQLKKLLDSGADWERLTTPIDGVTVVKMPATKNLAAKLSLEVNVPGIKKAKGLFVRDDKTRRGFATILENEDLIELLGIIEKLNPENRPSKQLKMSLKSSTSASEET